MGKEIPLLIADDDPISGLLLVESTKKWGYGPIWVQDGQAALEIMQRASCPKIAILDWMMPGINGIDLVKRIRELSFDVPPYLIMLTSKHGKEDMVQALGKGADDFIVKPFDPMELMARLGVGRRIVGLNEKLAVAIKEAKRLADFIAHYDQTTGLPNYHTLLEEISRLCKNSQGAALLLIDIDDFKVINQVLGVEAGDLLLNYLGARLKEIVGEGGMVSRLAADEFAMLVPQNGGFNGPPEKVIQGLAHRVQRALDMPFPLKEDEVKIKVSIGATWLDPNSEMPSDEFIRRADFSLRRAKQDGAHKTVLYDPQMEQELRERYAIERDLEKGIAAGELRLYLQPQFDIQSHIVGAEALVRWDHPERGLVAPGLFIPIAEECGLITRLGRWVLEAVCRVICSANDWTLPIAVNISPRQFNREEFIDEVREVLDTSGADPTRLVFEVTESLLIQDIHDTVKKMDDLARLGIRFSIDDFGTGYSSLMYLKKLPISEIKIDRSFIKDIPGDENDIAIVDAICAISKSMNLRVVAEGVETKDQLDFLLTRGDIIFQGFYFSKPRPWKEVICPH